MCGNLARDWLLRSKPEFSAASACDDAGILFSDLKLPLEWSELGGRKPILVALESSSSAAGFREQNSDVCVVLHSHPQEFNTSLHAARVGRLKFGREAT